MKVQFDGNTVFYGTGSGNPQADAPTMIFLHGAGHDHTVWVMQARYFARHGFRVWALDLPGHGMSDGPALTTVDAMADWLQAFIASQHPAGLAAKVSLVGHSMGSLIVQSFAARYPLQLEKFALVATASPMPVTPLLLDAAKDNDHAAIDMANTWSHGQRSLFGVGENPGMSNLRLGERLLERVAKDVYYTDFAACNSFDGSGYPPAAAPGLVIAGEEDKMTPVKAGLGVAKALGLPNTVTLPGSGHSMFNESPNQLLDALADFFL